MTDSNHFSAYQRGYRAGKANLRPDQTGAFRRQSSDYVVNTEYLNGYLRGFAEAQVEAVATLNCELVSRGNRMVDRKTGKEW